MSIERPYFPWLGAVRDLYAAITNKKVSSLGQGKRTTQLCKKKASQNYQMVNFPS